MSDLVKSQVSPQFGWRSLSGEKLDGERLVRMVYMDDAGVSSREPLFVVAGVIVAPDHHYDQIEARLAELAIGIRPDNPYVVLHAVDLWHGSGDFPREIHGQEDRRNVVDSIAKLIVELGLSVVVGTCLKSEIPATEAPRFKEGRDVEISWPHVCAQLAAVQRAEQWMMQNVPDEVTQLVHEDIPRSKKIIKLMHNFLREPSCMPIPWPSQFVDGPIRLTKIKGPVYYADKREERLLQLADVCAFSFCRYMNGNDDVASIVDILKPCIFDWGGSIRRVRQQV